MHNGEADRAAAVSTALLIDRIGGSGRAFSSVAFRLGVTASLSNCFDSIGRTEYLRKLALLGRLPGVLRQWKDLRRRIERLESK